MALYYQCLLTTQDTSHLLIINMQCLALSLHGGISSTSNIKITHDDNAQEKYSLFDIHSTYEVLLFLTNIMANFYIYKQKLFN